MYEHVAEAFVPVRCAECALEKVCARSGAYCRSIAAIGTDKVLDFGEARAILKPTKEGLHFRVEAQDSIIFYGVRTLLLGSLSVVTPFPGEYVKWYPTEHDSFSELRRHSRNGHAGPGVK
jgi:hypothetical protein